MKLATSLLLPLVGPLLAVGFAGCAASEAQPGPTREPLSATLDPTAS